MLEYATALNVGKATEHQEDGFFLDPDRELFGVFDSMGGHRTGYIALEAAANLFKRWLATHDSAPFGPLFDLFDFTEALLTEEMREIEPNARGQGTCCTMLSFKGRWCFTTHIGDTRAYLYRNETLTQLTEDHTLSKHYQRFGFFSSEAEFENFPYHNVLVRALLGVSEQAQATGRAPFESAPSTAPASGPPPGTVTSEQKRKEREERKERQEETMAPNMAPNVAPNSHRY